MEVYLFDDDAAARWLPFARTRPVGELLFGAHTFRERAARLFGDARAHIAPHLAGFDETGCAPVLHSAGSGSSAPRLFLSSRAVVDWGIRFDPQGPGTVSIAGTVVGCFLVGPGLPPADFFRTPHEYHVDTAPDGNIRFERTAGQGARYELPGLVLEHVWDLIVKNGAQIASDFAHITSQAPSRSSQAIPTGVYVIGGSSDQIRLENDVTLEPGVVLDVSTGPIWLDSAVTIRSSSRVQGPAYVGPGSTLLGGPFTAVSVGPVCKVHGEIEESVILGYSNKAHDGFLGHAYLGRWVNLGALTTNSDLKNNYGSIRLWTPDGETDTRQMKIGCLLGDHVKTGIGVMLNTGTIIEVGSNVFGAVQPPKYVPPFRWGSGSDLAEYDFDRFITTARTVMARRNVTLADGHAELLHRVARAAHTGAGVS